MFYGVARRNDFTENEEICNRITLLRLVIVTFYSENHVVSSVGVSPAEGCDVISELSTASIFDALGNAKLERTRRGK